jgi:hypothetical protein
MRKLSVCLLILGLLAVTGRGDSPPAPKRKPKFTVGKETTYVTGPLDKDGYVDYAAALNKRMSAGIKPEDNANVLLWKALGPRPEGMKVPPEFFKWLGIPEPPERGEYFIELARFLQVRRKINSRERLREIQAQLARATQRPWTEKDYPEIAAWLKANEKPLVLVVEATGRPHYIMPLVPPRKKDGPAALLEARLPGVQQCRDFANALAARALLRVGQGKPGEAWNDLLACHRLARFPGRGTTLIEALVGMYIESVASKADLAFLDGGKLSAKQIKACRRELEQLPPFRSVADTVDRGERLVVLDLLLMIDRRGVPYIQSLGGDAPPPEPDPTAVRPLDGADWDQALRNANRWYDRLVAALRVKDRPAREKELRKLAAELRELKSAQGGAKPYLKILLAKDRPTAKATAIGEVLVGLMLPPTFQVQHAADRTEQTRANLRVAFALALYRAEHGRYPAKLDALAPKYLPTVPGDLFNGKALVYKPTERGYLLYSVGVNGVDDGGQTYGDDPPGDDLAVRMPLPKLR